MRRKGNRTHTAASEKFINKNETHNQATDRRSLRQLLHRQWVVCRYLNSRTINALPRRLQLIWMCVRLGVSTRVLRENSIFLAEILILDDDTQTDLWFKIHENILCLDFSYKLLHHHIHNISLESTQQIFQWDLVRSFCAIQLPTRFECAWKMNECIRIFLCCAWSEVSKQSAHHSC